MLTQDFKRDSVMNNLAANVVGSLAGDDGSVEARRNGNLQGRFG